MPAQGTCKHHFISTFIIIDMSHCAQVMNLAKAKYQEEDPEFFKVMNAADDHNNWYKV